MKIDDLKNSFDAISPTAEQKDKMLTEILNAEEIVITKVLDIRRLLATVACLAAVIAISVVAFNYGDFNINEETNMIVRTTEETVQKETIKEESVIKKSEKTEKKPNNKKSVQVAAAKPVTESAPANAPANTPVSKARTIEAPENITEETNENSGIAVASEAGEQDYGIAIVSEEGISNDLEWMTVPSLEEGESLEEENIKIEEDEKTEEESEESEENEAETEEVTK